MNDEERPGHRLGAVASGTLYGRRFGKVRRRQRCDDDDDAARRHRERIR
ncbi:hypothetical protein [Dietzia sp. B32]|nr:hypothetical protein [Dietzia sp. B32]UVE96692.1 hypothetical protein L8M95_08005 [Dietzia sp. B32]